MGNSGISSSDLALSVLKDINAAVAHVAYETSGGLFTATGSSKRERGDSPDQVTGEMLAVARSLESLAAKLHRRARGRIRAAEYSAAQARRAEGWGSAPSGKFHYFRNGKSLCGKEDKFTGDLVTAGGVTGPWHGKCLKLRDRQDAVQCP